jgi:hypothetical protein
MSAITQLGAPEFEGGALIGGSEGGGPEGSGVLGGNWSPLMAEGYVPAPVMCSELREP